MRKEYRKAARRRFAELMAEKFPGLRPEKVAAPILLGGEAVFRWAPSDRLHGFVLLVPDAKGRQAFTVEVGWSTAGRFPEVTMRPSLALAPDDPDPVDVPEGIVRVGDLATRRDLWWHLPDRAAERPGDLEALKQSLQPLDAATAGEHVAGPVEEAIRTLDEAGVPFLEALARKHVGEDVTPR